MNYDLGLLEKEFIVQMNRLKITDRDRLPRYYAAVKDLPVEALIEITDDFLDGARHTPLPKDFRLASAEWRKNYFLKNGHYYGSSLREEALDKIDCDWCFDCGVSKIEHHDKDSFKQLVKCDCAAGKANGSALLQWSKELTPMFRRIAIDPVWFNPQILPNDNEVEMKNKIWKKVDAWKQIIRKSELYWANAIRESKISSELASVTNK